MKLKRINNHVFTDEGIDKCGKQLPKLGYIDVCPICGEKMSKL